jgi:arylformamidase
MRIYDISQEIFACAVYPDDPTPKRQILKSINGGDVYNLTAFCMCAHNGTHIDAPSHFIKDGKTVDNIDLSRFVGLAYVISHHGDVTADDAAKMLENAKKLNIDARKKILIKGEATVTLEAADVFAEAGIDLVGNESQTVGPIDAPMQVHLRLLSENIVLLEGIRLSDVPDGVYFLNAAPINLGGADGAPVRAILIEF